MNPPRKKILYVITKSNWGGAQKYVHDLAVSLPKDRFEPVVVFGGAGALEAKLKEAGVRTISLVSLQRDISVMGDIRSFFGLLSVFRRERPDIVHVNSSKVGGLGALAGRIVGTKRIVFTCHGWPWNEERSLPSLWTIRFLSWLTVMLSHVTIAVSERDLRDGRRLPWAENRIRLVHNGVREPEFIEKSAARGVLAGLARERGVEISNADFLVGAIGELHKNKGYEYLLQAVSKLPAHIKLAIIGEGEERARLERSIREGGLEKRAALLGFVENAPTYLRAFDAFALTSIKEGLPYVVIEAGYASLPVVATNVGGVKEIVEDMKSGILIQTRKPEDIAQAVELLRDDREKALAFGGRLHENILARFSLSRMVDSTIAVYEA